jgi:hypothetical protein
MRRVSGDASPDGGRAFGKFRALEAFLMQPVADIKEAVLRKVGIFENLPGLLSLHFFDLISENSIPLWQDGPEGGKRAGFSGFRERSAESLQTLGWLGRWTRP